MSLRDLIDEKARDRVWRDRRGTTSLIGLIDDHLKAKSTGPRRPGFHPSDMGYTFCPRFFALAGLGLVVRDRTITPQLQRIFDNGHFMHDRMNSYVRELGVLTQRPEILERGMKRGRKRLALEVRLDHPVGITGNADAVLELDGFLEVGDYKSANDAVFRRLVAPLPYNERQLTVYLGMLDHLYEGDPPLPLRGRFLYESKNDQSLREFIVPWDEHHQELFAQLIRYLEIVNQAVAQDTPELAPCIPSCGKCEGYGTIDELRSRPKVVDR